MGSLTTATSPLSATNFWPKHGKASMVTTRLPMVGGARPPASAIDANRDPSAGNEEDRRVRTALVESVKWNRAKGEPLDPLTLGL